MSQATATFTMTVNPSGQPSVIVLTPNGADLPAGQVGIPVADQLVTNVSGGVAPYDFAVSAGSVPDGLGLNATTLADGSEDITLDGTPTVAGDYSFDLTVTDANGQTASARVRRSIA